MRQNLILQQFNSNRRVVVLFAEATELEDKKIKIKKESPDHPVFGE